MNLTAADIASFPVVDRKDICWPFQTSADVNKACRDKTIRAFKTSDRPFSKWAIPVDAFVYYLESNPVYKKMFLKMEENDLKIIGLENAFDAVKKQLAPIGHVPSEESFTIEQLKYIFDAPANQIKMWFNRRVRLIKTVVYAHEISEFFDTHPERLAMVEERHKMILASGDPNEYILRHVLMVHDYHKSIAFKEEK